MKSIKKIVVKFGTESLFGNDKKMSSKETVEGYVRQIALLYKEGFEVVVVSSGAIASGKERLSVLGKDESVFSKKELASIGTRHLFNKWGDAFASFGLDIAPILVTYANWENVNERQSIKKSIIGCCKNGIVPVINENDVVSDEEIRSMEKGIGENDRLARMIATLIEGDAVLFLTNVSGVYESDPHTDLKARLFAELDKDNAFAQTVCDGVSSCGRGGIAIKIQEAVACVNELPSVHVAIAGNEKDVIVRFAHGEDLGTRIGSTTRFMEKAY